MYAGTCVAEAKAKARASMERRLRNLVKREEEGRGSSPVLMNWIRSGGGRAMQEEDPSIGRCRWAPSAGRGPELLVAGLCLRIDGSSSSSMGELLLTEELEAIAALGCRADA